MLTTLRDKFAQDPKYISVAQGRGCAVIFVSNVKPVLSQFLEPGVIICYCAAGTECESVKRISFG
jgi:hypothetical protein